MTHAGNSANFGAGAARRYFVAFTEPDGRDYVEATDSKQASRIRAHYQRQQLETGWPKRVTVNEAPPEGGTERRNYFGVAATDAIHFGRSHATVVIKTPSAQRAYASARAIFGGARVAVGKEYAISSDKSGNFKITAPYVTTKTTDFSNPITTDFSNPIVTTPKVKVAPIAVSYPQYTDTPTTQAQLAHQLQLCQAALATAQRQYGSHGVPYQYDGGLSPEERLRRATEALMADAFGGICPPRIRRQVTDKKVWKSSNGRWLVIRVRARRSRAAKDLGLQRIKDAGFSSKIRDNTVKATRKCGDGVRHYIYTVQVKLKTVPGTVVHRRRRVTHYQIPEAGALTPEQAREELKESSCSLIRQGRVLSGSVRQNNAGTKIYTTVLATSTANAIEQANGRFALTAWADRAAPATRSKTYCTVARGWKVYNMVSQLTQVVQPATPMVQPQIPQPQTPQPQTPQTYTDHIQLPQTQEEYNRCAWTRYASLPEGSMCDPETGELTSVPGYWQLQQQTQQQQQQEQQIADQYGPGWFVDEQGWYYDPSADPNAQTDGWTPQGYTASEQDYYSQGYSQSAPSDAYASTSYDSANADSRLEQGIQALMADSFGATVNAVFGNDPYSNYF